MYCDLWISKFKKNCFRENYMRKYGICFKSFYNIQCPMKEFQQFWFLRLKKRQSKIPFFMLKKWENRILFTSVFKLILLHLVCLPLSSFVLENCCYKNPLCTSLCLVYQITIISRLHCNSILHAIEAFLIIPIQQVQSPLQFFMLQRSHKMRQHGRLSILVST